MTSYLLREPEALAVLLLLSLVGGTLLWGLLQARRAESEGSRAEEKSELVTTWPHLVRRELLVAMGVLLVLSWWAIGLEVPLGPPADPAVTPSVAKAPWFFVGVQELLQYFDAWLAGAVLPLLFVFGLCALPYLDREPWGAGRYGFRGRRVMQLTLGALLLFWFLPMVVGQFFRGAEWSLQPAWRPAPIDAAPPTAARSLAELLGLGSVRAQLLGALVCLGPFLALTLAWPHYRRRDWAARLGLARYLVAGALLLAMLGVVIKVAVVLALDVRYLWVTPWFRI